MSRRDVITLLGSAGLFSLSGLNSFIRKPNSFINNQTNKMTNSENNNGQTMKAIGILGGLGPQATIDLELRLHKAAQQTIPQEKNSGYPPMVVQYYRHAPVLLADENTRQYHGNLIRACLKWQGI